MRDQSRHPSTLFVQSAAATSSPTLFLTLSYHIIIPSSTSRSKSPFTAMTTYCSLSFSSSISTPTSVKFMSLEKMRLNYMRYAAFQLYGLEKENLNYDSKKRYRKIYGRRNEDRNQLISTPAQLSSLLSPHHFFFKYKKVFSLVLHII